MIDTLKAAWRLPDLRKKLLFTIMMLIVFRFGSTIPVPGVSSLEKLVGDSSTLSLFGIMDLFSGGAFSQATIFAMGISPYINSSIIIQLLGVAIPALERLQKEGEEGRKKIQSLTRIVTIALAIIQGIGLYFLMNNYKLLTGGATFVGGFIVVTTLAAGTAFVMWIGEQITDKGIGNGISLLIFTGIVARIPYIIQKVAKNYAISTEWYWIALIVIYALGMIAFVVYFDSSERRIPVQYSKRVVGRKMYGGQSSHIPLKVAMAGVLPIIFAISILAFPTTIIQLFTGKTSASDIATIHPFLGKVVEAFSSKSWVYALLYFLLIIAFTYFYTSITINPIEMANNMKKNGGFIPGIRPGKPTSDFIGKSINKLNIAGSLFLSIVAIVPIIIGLFSSRFSSIGLLGGSSLLILVGVALETVKQIEAQLMMRHYKGFLE
ncbi:MAG: preprotein translocase subunit SecY [Bacillota bacterium]|nr:preprotein translocase subunit SecY [Bacillota bacterium]